MNENKNFIHDHSINNINYNKKQLKLSSSSFIPKGLSTNENNKLSFPMNSFNNNFLSNNYTLEKNKFDFNPSYNQIGEYLNSNNFNFITNVNNQEGENDNQTLKISLDTNVKNTITYIINYFEKDKNTTIYLTGLNLAISKVILIAEIVKIKIRNLHQINKMDCLIADNSYKIDKEDDEGDIKRIPKFEIILTKIEPHEKGSGYQRPLSEEQIKILSERYLNMDKSSIKEKIIKRNNVLTEKIKNISLCTRKIKRVRRIHMRRNLIKNKKITNSK